MELISLWRCFSMLGSLVIINLKLWIFILLIVVRSLKLLWGWVEKFFEWVDFWWDLIFYVLWDFLIISCRCCLFLVMVGRWCIGFLIIFCGFFVWVFLIWILFEEWVLFLYLGKVLGMFFLLLWIWLLFVGGCKLRFSIGNKLLSFGDLKFWVWNWKVSWFLSRWRNLYGKFLLLECNGLCWWCWLLWMF